MCSSCAEKIFTLTTKERRLWAFEVVWVRGVRVGVKMKGKLYRS